jgi:hypothetical protein
VLERLALHLKPTEMQRVARGRRRSILRGAAP